MPQTTPDVDPSGYGVGTPDAKRVGEQLTALAARPELEGAEVQLASIAKAMSDDDHAELWRGMAIRDHFRDALRPSVRGVTPLKLRILTGLRMLLVFVPVGLTWVGIHGAASAYNDLLSAQPELEAQSFFRLWLEGFGGELLLPFDRMALLIAVSMGLLVAVWIYAERAQEKHEEDIEADLDDLAAEFERALTGAQLHLNVATASTTQDVVATLNQVARQVDKVVARAENLLGKVSSAATDIAEASRNVEEAVEAVREAADAATKAVTSIGETANATVGRLDGAADGLASSMRGFQSDLSDTVRDLQRQQNEELQRANGELRNTLNAIVQELNNIADQSEQHAGVIGELLGSHRTDTAEIIPRVAVHLNNAVGAQLEAHKGDIRQAFEAHDRHLQEKITPLLEAQAKAMVPELQTLTASYQALSQHIAALHHQIVVLNGPGNGTHRESSRLRWWRR